MLKGCLYLVVLFVMVSGASYYIYEKYGEKIDEYASEQWQNFYDEKISPEFENFKSAYADSAKILLRRKIDELRKGELKLSGEKFGELKKILENYSNSDNFDKEDFLKLKEFFK